MGIFIVEEITTRKIIVSAKDDILAISKVESGLGEEVSVEVFRQSEEVIYRPKHLFVSEESTHTQDALNYSINCEAPQLYQDHSSNSFWKR
jgi:hypothetical protein